MNEGRISPKWRIAIVKSYVVFISSVVIRKCIIGEVMLNSMELEKKGGKKPKSMHRSLWCVGHCIFNFFKPLFSTSLILITTEQYFEKRLAQELNHPSVVIESVST